MLRRAALAGLAFAALAAAGSGPGEADPKTAAPAPDPLAAETRRRNDALVKEGFNLTHGFALGPKAVRFEFLLPRASDAHRITFWMEAREGEASVTLRGPGGESLFAWAGRRGESDVTRALAAGAYVLEIGPAGAPGGRALLGVKGFLVHACETDAARTSEQPAAPARGFHWPYLLYVPREARAGHLLVAPNNTGFSTADVDVIRASSSCEVRREAALAERLGAPLLVPLFPRPPAGEDDNLYLQALTRAALETAAPALKRVDLQLLAMADDARRVLAAKGVVVDAKLLLKGFSASGSFVNRFAVLHPARVLAVACGSPGGWPIAPVGKDGGESLPYPVGVADVRALTGGTVDARALRGVAWLFFLGDKDENDAVVFRDSFSKADEDLVFRRFGPTPVARWKKAEDLYASGGLDARFVLYPGIGHQVTPEIDADVAAFFEKRLAGAKPVAP